VLKQALATAHREIAKLAHGAVTHAKLRPS
jgi:hypothetical protein